MLIKLNYVYILKNNYILQNQFHKKKIKKKIDNQVIKLTRDLGKKSKTSFGIAK